MEHYTLSPSTGQNTVCFNFGVLECVYQLVKVQGISVALIEKNEDWITVVTGSRILTVKMTARPKWVSQGTLSPHVLLIGIRQS